MITLLYRYKIKNPIGLNLIGFMYWQKCNPQMPKKSSSQCLQIWRCFQVWRLSKKNTFKNIKYEKISIWKYVKYQSFEKMNETFESEMNGIIQKLQYKSVKNWKWPIERQRQFFLLFLENSIGHSPLSHICTLVFWMIPHLFDDFLSRNMFSDPY